VAIWNTNAGEPQDWVLLGRRALWIGIGGMLLAGGLRRRWSAPLLIGLPALAAGLVRWTTGFDGHPVLVVDRSAWAFSIVAVLGGVWMFVAPWAASPVRWWRTQWGHMVAADVARREAAERSAAGAAERAADGEADGESVSHRAPAAPAGGAGRHRA
jgi:hypothetical protein